MHKTIGNGEEMDRLIFVSIAGAMLLGSLEAVVHKRQKETEPPPWFTGPLLAQSSTVVALGHIDFEPYLNAANNCSTYNNHWKTLDQPNFTSLNSIQPLWIGIASWADVLIQPMEMWNRTENAANWALGDLIIGLEVQAVAGSTSGTWRPSVKLALWETFPTGKYRNSSPRKKLTDLGGMGSYVSRFMIMVGNLEHIYDDHFFHWEINLSYTVPSKAHVKGINAYGGSTGTDGTVSPGNQTGFDLGMEYNLSQHWALAMDIVAIWQSATHFHGTPGIDATGNQASSAPPASIQYSLAPGLEYNFNQNLGLIGGVWFSVAGKNTDQFMTGMIALNYFR